MPGGLFCAVAAFIISVPEPLIELRDNCSPQSWFNNSGWTSSPVVPVCTWFGVGCSPAGQITSLNLYGNGLSGATCGIPRTISHVQNLQYLSVGNNFVGALGIPKEIGNLTKLVYLNLEMANLTGTLPVGIVLLPHLQRLILRSNGLSGKIPTKFDSPIKQLQLANNFFSGRVPAPSSFKFPDQLEEMSLHTNTGLTGTLAEDGWGAFISLRHFYLAKNSGIAGVIPISLCDAIHSDVDCTMDEIPFNGTVPPCLPLRCKAKVQNERTERISVRASQSAHGGDTANASLLRWRFVAGGGEHTCGLLTGASSDNSSCLLRCWGDNSANQTNIPNLPGGYKWKSVSAGDGATTCAIASDSGRAVGGRLYCWGADEHGQATVPSDIPNQYHSVSVGRYFTCALTFPTLEIRCWGRNEAQQTAPPKGAGYTSLSCGAQFCCALTNDASVQCWGCSAQNKCKFAHRQTFVPAGLKASTVQVGGFAACAIDVSNDKLVCWGTDVNGESSVPALFGRWKQLSLARYGSCGLTNAGRVLCWGIRGLCREGHCNTSKTGHCTLSQTRIPPLPPMAKSWSYVGVGAWHGCAIADNGRIRCWGANDHGQSNPPTI